jgi:hypothetical protein
VFLSGLKRVEGTIPDETSSSMSYAQQPGASSSGPGASGAYSLCLPARLAGSLKGLGRFTDRPHGHQPMTGRPTPKAEALTVTKRTQRKALREAIREEAIEPVPGCAPA